MLQNQIKFTIFATEINLKSMTETELSIKLREDARRIGLCDKWYNEWKDDTSMQDLIGKFLRGSDFCFSKRWPSLQFIKTHFPQELLRRNGILVDDVRSFPERDRSTRRLIYLDDYVLLGESQAVIRYSFKPHICNVWVLDKSYVNVDVKYGAFVMIHLLDNSSANIKTDMVSKVTVIRHSHNVKLKKEGIVNVKDEFHYLK